MIFEYLPAPKPSHNRRIKKRKERGRVTSKTYEKVFERDNGQCAMCGRGTNVEAHHARFRSDGGSGEEWNIVLACGPVTQKNTCHWAAHNKMEARRWFEDYLSEIYPQHWR